MLILFFSLTCLTSMSPLLADGSALMWPQRQVAEPVRLQALPWGWWIQEVSDCPRGKTAFRPFLWWMHLLSHTEKKWLPGSKRSPEEPNSQGTLDPQSLMSCLSSVFKFQWKLKEIEVVVVKRKQTLIGVLIISCCIKLPQIKKHLFLTQYLWVRNQA